MLANEYAAGGYECRPCQGAYRECSVSVIPVVPESYDKAHYQGERIGCVGGEKAIETTSTFQDRDTVYQHPAVIAGPQAVYGMLDYAGQLVA